MGNPNHNSAVRVVADCGATSTTWAIGATGGEPRLLTTSGINVTLADGAAIAGTLRRELPPELLARRVERVHVYAAGCRTAAQRAELEGAIAAVMPGAKVTADTDMLGAARALCGHADGIAAILGTGSNCCLYKAAEGGRIVAAVSPGGFILGDEGSGAAIGRRLASDFIKGLMPAELVGEFGRDYGPAEEIITRTYRRPAPSAFLASMARFAGRYAAEPYVDSVLAECFDAFLRRNVARLPGAHRLPVGFAGGVAAAFAPQLEQALQRAGLHKGRITASPIIDLAEFHKICL